MKGEKLVKGLPFLRTKCVPILPLTYDESLSYYEVLCKLTAKVNELVEIINRLNAEKEKEKKDG